MLPKFIYRISSNSSRASNKRRASNTGRGSEPFVPIDAGGFYSRKYGSRLLKVSVVSADITISGKLFHTFTIMRAKENFLKS